MAILEIGNPTVIRRKVAFATAMNEEQITVEGIRARRAENIHELYQIMEEGDIPVLADAKGESLAALKPSILVDGILAKKNLGTDIDMAPIVVALGPGFEAGKDCDAVIETARGHELGRVILNGSAAANTGTPGIISGKGAERVLRAPCAGLFEPVSALGDIVKTGEKVAQVVNPDSGESIGIAAPFNGKIRGLLSPGIVVTEGFKVGDVDPRGAEVDESLISDKARAVAGGVLEAIFHLRSISASR